MPSTISYNNRSICNSSGVFSFGEKNDVAKVRGCIKKGKNSHNLG